ncbi:MAG: DUF2384 domain-containing protein [Frankiaceae bacterium]|nr:DUF2384 domain-containing protein [Frankiaceae bacterium]
MSSLLNAPASYSERTLVPDLALSAARRRLTPKVLPGLRRLASRWQLTTDQVCTLLGDVSPSSWYAWKSKPPADLGVDRLTRASLLLGIYTSLRALYADELADTWLRLPNTNVLFHGRSPLEVMLGGGIPAMVEVRGLLDGRRGGM